MSKHHMEKITCPSCHHDGDFEVWDSINTVLDPEMKEKVLNQSIFLYTCPNCGETFRLNYPTLYHQMEDLVMIYLVPESEVEKTYEMFYGENALADYRTEKYLNRIVTSANQLVEKIQIFDAGKDDRIMELVKLLATDSILKNDPDKEFDELRFAVDDDGTNILVIAPFVGIVFMVVYKVHRAKNDMVMDVSFVNVRREYILMLPLCYRVGKLLSDFMGFLIIDFPRLKGLYQMKG